MRRYAARKGQTQTWSDHRGTGIAGPQVSLAGRLEQLSPGRSQDSCSPPRGAGAVPGDRGPTYKGRIDGSRMLGSAQVTDSYLLALAGAHGGQVAGFDRRLIVDAVIGGSTLLHLIG
jgi:hypothetical protein